MLHSNITEPKSGFRIAFNMFDTDGNQRVEKFEFLVVSEKTTYVSLHYCVSLYFPISKA